MFRARLALFLTLMLTACGPDRDVAPFTDVRLPPNLAPRFWAPDGWAWGLVRMRGKPALRYGVVAPPGMNAGQVVIMTGYGETAEGWFETARDLVARDYSVWVIEAAGQGGSGRYKAPRDLGRAPDFEADIDCVRALVGGIMRPKAGESISLIASGAAAPAAIAAVARGLPVRNLVLSHPGDAAVPAGQAGWVRPKDTASMTQRQRDQLGWVLANPDLRMGGPTPGWRAAWSSLNSQTASAGFRSRVKAEVTILSPDAKSRDCAGFIHCRPDAIASIPAYQLGEDSARQTWLVALLSAVAPDHGA